MIDIEIHKNTIRGNTVGLGFRKVVSEWPVDATKIFWSTADGPDVDGGGPGTDES